MLSAANIDIALILPTDAARKHFASYGREPVARTPAAFTAFIRTNHARGGQAIRASTIKAE